MEKLKVVKRMEEAYLIEDLESLIKELEEREEEYWFLWDDNGGDTDGPCYLIMKHDVAEEDREIFEKYSKTVEAICIDGYEAELRDLLREVCEDFDRKVKWWGSQVEEKAIFCVEEC